MKSDLERQLDSDGTTDVKTLLLQVLTHKTVMVGLTLRASWIVMVCTTDVKTLLLQVLTHKTVMVGLRIWKYIT